MNPKAQRDLFIYITSVTLLLLGANIYKVKLAHEAQAATLKVISPIPSDTPTPTPAPTKADIIAQAKHGDIIARIHYLETSNGTAPTGYHRGCEAKGYTNEFGYGVYSHICFTTFEQSVAAVDAWFDKTLKKNTLAQALCLYNIGEAVSDCEYARDFMAR